MIFRLRPAPSTRHSPAIAFCALLLICAGAINASAVPAPPKMEDQGRAQKAQIDLAKRLLDAGDREGSIQTLQKLISDSPEGSHVPEAYSLLGRLLTEMGNTEEAAGYYRLLLEEYPASEFAPAARVALGLALLRAGQVDVALPLLQEAKGQTPDAASRLAVLAGLEEAYLAKGDHAKAIEAAAEARALSSEENGQRIEDRIRQMLRKAGEPDLRRIAERYLHDFPGDAALLRLLELHVAAGDDFKVTRDARQFLQRFPKHPLAGIATDALIAQRKKLKGKDVIIGALLPFTGSLQSYSQDVLNGARVALDEALETSSRFSLGLVTKDTEGDDKMLAIELDDLLEGYRPVAVIGPLLTRNVKAIAPAADLHQVPFLTPTATLSEVQRLSPYLFNTGVNNRALVRDLAAYAIDALGCKRVTILAPQDAYGAEMAQTFTEEMRRLGAEIIVSETYALDVTDFGQPIKRIKDVDLKRYGKLETSPTVMKKGKPVKMYVPGFDAIFLPGDAAKVGLIAGQLQFHGMKVVLLGTNGMNSPDLIRIGSRAVEGAVFADSFFVDSPEPAVRNFVERYVRRFKEPPSPFAAQAYEAMQLALSAVRGGALTGRAVRDRIASTRNVPGLAGPVSMNPTGYLERRYSIIQVKGGKFVPAPPAAFIGPQLP